MFGFYFNMQREKILGWERIRIEIRLFWVVDEVAGPIKLLKWLLYYYSNLKEKINYVSMSLLSKQTFVSYHKQGF